MYRVEELRSFLQCFARPGRALHVTIMLHLCIHILSTYRRSMEVLQVVHNRRVVTRLRRLEVELNARMRRVGDHRNAVIQIC